MGQKKANGKILKAQENRTEAQTCSLLDTLQDETKALNTADKKIQAPVWTKAVNDLNDSFWLKMDIDQVKNHWAQVSVHCLNMCGFVRNDW